MRQRMGAGPGDVVVGYVGRVAPEKGLHEALLALAPLVDSSHGRLRVAVAGDGPDEARCRSVAPAGSWFAGALRGDELSAFFASLDLLVFPSTTETFGNVVLEAMASGVPVIAPDVGATLEMAHEGTAALFEAARPASIGTLAADLGRDPARRAALAAAGLRVAAERSWDAIWDALVSEYRDAATRQVLRVA
jgi:glycosyltransferase involved in cell wall biosynthesis